MASGRNNLPWRKGISPYKVWISEIMLQQTQVKTVIPFFNAFIKKFPNLKSISKASEDEILALWTGLGFYRRAKNIFKTKGIPFRSFDVLKKSEESLGELFTFFMLETILLGKMMKINPFDQYGVEVGKKLTREFHKRT